MASLITHSLLMLKKQDSVLMLMYYLHLLSIFYRYLASICLFSVILQKLDRRTAIL